LSHPASRTLAVLTGQIESDGRLAQRMAAVADEAAMAHFGKDVRVRTKRDGSLVSDADYAVESAIVDILTAERPRDRVLSEEGGHLRPGGRRRWLIDPIDGTAAFLAGRRDWGTHIALTVEGRLTVAVFTRPTESARWWAVSGGGAFVTAGDGSRRLRISQATSLERARVGGLVEPASRAAASLARQARWVSDDVSIIGALLDARVDAVLDEGGAPWDLAPAALLVTEAGGVFRDPHGGERIDLAWGLFTNARLEPQVRAAIGG